MTTNKHSVLNGGNGIDGFRMVDLSVSQIKAEGLAGSDETYTMNISDNPYHPRDVIRFKTNGPVTMSVPLPRFIRHLVEIYGYDTIKKTVDNFPQELRGGDR